MKNFIGRSMTVITCIIMGISLNGCGALMNVANTVNEAAYSLRIETPGRRMEVKLTNTELIENGKQFMMEFLLTNHGQEIGTYWIGKETGGSPMIAYDNMGTASTVHITWGNSNTWATGQIGATLPDNVPVLMKVFVSNFNPQATMFSQIKFFASCGSFNVPCEGAAGSFIFRNVPIR